MNARKFNLPLVLLLLAVCVVAFVRIRLLTMPLERDEGEFAYGGQLMLQGIPPYKLFYNMKFPGIYAAYALIMAVFGQTAAGIHFGFLLVNLLGIWLLHRLALRFLDKGGAAAAAASYALLSVSPRVLGMAAHATHFVVAAALAGLLLLLRGEETGKRRLICCSGLFMALACLMKQPGAMFGLFGFCLLAAGGARDREQWRMHCGRIALYVLGGAAPLAVTAVVLWLSGVFPRFWFWAVVYARVHAAELPWYVGRLKLGQFLQNVFTAGDGLFWLLACLGLVSLALSREDRRKKLWLIGFLAFSAGAVCMSNYFSDHYFVMALPALCLLAGQAAGAILRRGGAAWFAAVFASICLVFLCYYRLAFFVLSPDQVCKQTYYPNAFVECQEIGRYLRDHSPPDATVAVLGSEPEIFFYACRHSATGYIYMYDFFELQPYAAEMEHEMMAQVEKARPEYLVSVNMPISWDLRPDFQRVADAPIVPWAGKYAKDFYEAVGLIIVNYESEYYWGQDALNRSPGDRSFIHIFKRK